MNSSRPYYVGFSLVKGIGSRRLARLLEAFGDISLAWNASPELLQQAGLGSKLAQSLVKVRSQINLDEEVGRIESSGINILTWDDADYPARLKEAGQPPPVLYCRGNYQESDGWGVAVVGTRRLTSYGRQAAENVARILASKGVTIISGLARGIDGIAHFAALEAGGRTIAVLGSGVDRIYPPEHQRLAERIASQGLVLSDYPPGTLPEAVNFPPRNRIISALSRAVVVVEAGENSGALITAAFAVEQGREVFAVPGNIHAPQSTGTNRLIQQGARLLLDPQEILEVLNLTKPVNQTANKLIIPVDSTEAVVLAAIGGQPAHIDDICQLSGLTIEKVSATLTIMEIKGYVRHVGGMQYVAVRESTVDYE